MRYKKCKNCSKIFPETVDICDNCGSVEFVFIKVEVKNSKKDKKNKKNKK